MCIDAPESTTNSRSSGSRVDGASKQEFSESEKEECRFILLLWFHNTFGQPPRCFTGAVALAIPSLPETDPQIFGALLLR